MNRLQKQALAGVIIDPIGLLLLIYFFVVSSGFKKNQPFSHFLIIWVLCIISYLLGMWARRKDSKAEPDFDERDRFIKLKAVKHAYITIWCMLVATLVAAFFLYGSEGFVPASLLPFTLVSIFMIVSLIYSVSVLLQYHWGNKHGE